MNQNKFHLAGDRYKVFLGIYTVFGYCCPEIIAHSVGTCEHSSERSRSGTVVINPGGSSEDDFV